MDFAPMIASACKASNRGRARRTPTARPLRADNLSPAATTCRGLMPSRPRCRLRRPRNQRKFCDPIGGLRCIWLAPPLHLRPTARADSSSENSYHPDLEVSAMRHSRGLFGALLALLLVGYTVSPAIAADGQMTWGVHISLAPTWFDPGRGARDHHPIHALLRAPRRPREAHAGPAHGARAWRSPGARRPTASSYEFILRKGVKFHNGDPVTPEDVKFSFERYQGAAAQLLKQKVAAVEIVDAQRVRFRLKQPWPDFMTFYGTPATGAGWIVPKKYVEKVGDDGFKKAPVGAGPYRFVSFTPGVELVLEANEHYWRKPPSVKTLRFRVIPDEATRLAALKRGEVDIAYSIRGALAEELEADAGAYPQAGDHSRLVLAALRRAMGSQVAVGRQARAARRQPRPRPASDQPGRDAGLLENHGEHHPEGLRVRLAGPALPLRSQESDAAPDGSRVPERLRRRRALL